MITLFIIIELAGNLMPSMSGSCTTICWLLSKLHSWFREVYMMTLTKALLLEINLDVFDRESAISVKVFASSKDPNCIGISLLFIRPGGSLLPLLSV